MHKFSEQRDALNTSEYEIGRVMGVHWARRDASAELLMHFQNLGDGRSWVLRSKDAVSEFLALLETDASSFLGTGELPSNFFIAGFIDGARKIAVKSN